MLFVVVFKNGILLDITLIIHYGYYSIVPGTNSLIVELQSFWRWPVLGSAQHLCSGMIEG
jgi:hypothetical protein